MKIFVRLLLIAAFVSLMLGWFWGFGYSFSSDFFRYHAGRRLLVFVMAMAAVAVPPLSGYWAVTRAMRHQVGAVKAGLLNLVISGLPLFVSWIVLTVWISAARRAGELAFEADEAMGIGIEFLFCQAVYLVSNVLVVGILVVWYVIERKRKRE